MDQISLALSNKQTRLITWTLLALFPMMGMAVDLVAPSLPAIATSLHVPDKIAKDVISIYLLGYALGNFATGFLTDALGRKYLIRIALCGFVVASLLPVIFPYISMLLGARFLQGATIGAIAVLARAIFSDVLPPERLIRLGTVIGTVWGLGPVVGPVIGGYLQMYFGWQAGFYFFAIMSALAFILVFFVIPETHFNRHPLHFKTIRKNLAEVLTHRVFMALAILMGLVYSLIVTFNVSGPFIIQTTLHYSPVFFGHLALWLGLVFLVSTFICRHLLQKYKVEQLFFMIIHVAFLIAASELVISYFFEENISLIAVASAFMFFACGFIFPMSMGKGLSLFRHIAGTATATMYLINMLITSLISFAVSFIRLQTTVPMMWIYLGLIAMGVFIYWALLREAG